VVCDGFYESGERVVGFAAVVDDGFLVFCLFAHHHCYAALGVRDIFWPVFMKQSVQLFLLLWGWA